MHRIFPQQDLDITAYLGNVPETAAEHGGDFRAGHGRENLLIVGEPDIADVTMGR